MRRHRFLSSRTLVLGLSASLLIAAGSAAAGRDASRQSAAVNSGLPSIRGSAHVGRALSAAAGSWTGSPAGYAYQWLMCSSGGGSCRAIKSATHASYVPSRSIAGKTVRVAVTATNRIGATVAVSSAFGPLALTSASAITPQPGYTFCSYEYVQCSFSGSMLVIYGANGTFTAPQVFTGGVACGNATFGDPVPGTVKYCETAPVPATTSTTTTTTTSGTPTPQPGYSFCSWEYAQCSFSGSMRVIYGANGTFTAPQVFTGGVACGNATFGDPTPGTVKHCETAPVPATTSTSTTTTNAAPPTPPQPGYTFCSWEYAQCSFSGSMRVIYGANGTFTAPQVFTGGVACGNATFGDPLVGTVKHCETAPLAATTSTSTTTTTASSIVPQPGYTFCSYEYAQCSFSGSVKVIYGANGTFTAPQVFTGGVACGNATFGDPLIGTVKHCETAPAGTTSTTTTTPIPPASGCSAPTSAVTSNWYSCAAAVNKPIPANPPISPYNSTLMANFVPQGSNVWNQYFIGPRNREVVAYPTSSTGSVTIQVNFPTCNNYTVTVPIPSTIQLTPANNEDYLVDMLPNGDQWDFWNISKPGVAPYNPSDWGGSASSCPANGNWQAIEAMPHSPGWTSLGTFTGGGSESGTFEGYGAIRLLDTQHTPTGGNWGHAIGWTGFDNCSSSNASGLPNYVSPATEGGGAFTNAGCFPMGSRWQLDPSINCDTWPSMANKAEWLKQMCRTLQVYGMIDIHSTFGQGDGDGFRTEYSPNFTGGQQYPWQDSSGNWPDPYSPNLNLPPDLLSHFRVIDWTKWSG